MHSSAAKAQFQSVKDSKCKKPKIKPQKLKALAAQYPGTAEFLEKACKKKKKEKRDKRERKA